MADTYTTEAIACGLSDVAGWLENEGLVLVPRRAAREQVMAWFHDRLGDPDQRRLIESIYETMVAASPVACGLAAPPGHIPMPRTVDEAKAMWLLGERYVRDNAPDQIAAAPSHPGEADRVGLGKERRLAEQAKHHGRDWAVWWQGSGDRGDHIMEVTQSGLGYARELAWIGDQHHVEAGALVAEHNEQVRRLREVIARQAAAKGLLQAELGRIKAVIPASLTYEVPDAAEAIASTFREYVKVAAEATALRKSLASLGTGEGSGGAGWAPGTTAPRDGTPMWADLGSDGIRKVRWWTVDELCDAFGGDRGNYQAGFYEVDDADAEAWPKQWLPIWAIPALSGPPSAPHPQAPNTLSEVEEATALLLAIDGVLRAAQQEADRLRDETDGYSFPNWLAQENHVKADRIEAALATLRASQEQDGEVRHG